MTGTRTRTVAEVPLDRGTFVTLANAMRGAGSPIPIDAAEEGNYIDGHGYMFVLTNTEVAAADLPTKRIPVELDDVQFTVVAHEAIEHGYIPGPFNEKWDALNFNGIYFKRKPPEPAVRHPAPVKKGRISVPVSDEVFSKAATDAINANLMEDEDADVVLEWSTFMIGNVIFQRVAKPVPVSLSGGTKEQPITAQFLLECGFDILDARAKEYDQPGGERDMEAIVKAFNAVTKRDSPPSAISEAEGWLFMSILKQVRLFAAKSFHLDSALDGCNYMALTGEAKARESK